MSAASYRHFLRRAYSLRLDGSRGESCEVHRRGFEFLAEVIYYSEAQAGLGTRFTAAVEEAAARALAFPLSGSPFRANTRRVFVQEFPFALIYRPEPEGIVIFAVAHHAKRPYYWQSRIRAR